MDQAPLTPDYSDGGGWHRDGQGMRIPGCESDLLDRRRRAWPGFVMRLRTGGVRMKAELLRNMEPIAGGVLMMPYGPAENWCANLFDLPHVNKPLLELLEAQLVRQGPDFRQYSGIEVIGRERWAQTWICTRTEDRMYEVLERMAQREFY